jgi:hypothetical protein
MLHVSHETRQGTALRLRNVLHRADLTHIGGDWALLPYGQVAPAGAIATILGEDGWSALMPAGVDALERFGLTLIRFPTGMDNSGFLGWLATIIKRRVGCGVFAVCGNSPRWGGIFDYLGYPLAVAGDVHLLLDHLRRRDDTSSDLDLRLFRVVETSLASAISVDTLFEFEERDGIVEATYSGGQVVSGILTGRRRDSTQVAVAYAQLGDDGQLRTGSSDWHLEQNIGGPLRLREGFIWSDGTPGWNVLEDASWREDA